MVNHFIESCQGKKIGLVYDIPEELKNFESVVFPLDARGEWEDQKTIDTIIETWTLLGAEVILFPLKESFLKQWSEQARSCTLIHSVVEAFGSLSREGWIASLCELSGIPYIGSSPFAHSLCMSKSHLKQICRALNIPTAPSYFLQTREELLKLDKSVFKHPVFLKPNGEGSGMGIDASFSICQTQKEAIEAAENLLQKYPEGIVLEKYLSGPEYTTAVLGTPEEFLPIAQIEVDDGVYGASNKGKDYMGERVTFPTLPENTQQMMKESSLKLCQQLWIYDFVRFDWKTDGEGTMYFLEANTLAGLSYHYSVVPLMAKEAGYDYKKLFEILYHSAMTRSQGRHLWYGKSRMHYTI